MSNYPDFDQYGYQVIKELGRNREAGRITYLATALNPDQKVVIKEFRFALADASWSGYKAYQREIEVLQQLDHPRIPRYLDSFETPQGFCLVQEYKNAPSLAQRRSFTPEQIKQIAVSVLEILVYLQQQVPPIIHRDIKPENILVDKQLNAYLVDFGFARIRGGEMALSSVAAGTLGFMPPEEQFGRPLTEASDLYSLGAMLICLLTGTRSLDIGKLIDDNYRFDFKRLVPQLNPGFIAWLEKMVAANVKQRFQNAAAAKAALQSLPSGGKANLLETIGYAIKLRVSAPVLGLLTFVTLLGSGWLVYVQAQSNYKKASDNTVKQLLETGHCEGCNLQNADLMGANLEFSNLISADLRGANLVGANLRGAKMPGANLAGADLRGANLEKTYLAGVWSSSADGEKTCLQGANLTNANLENSNLQGAYLGSNDAVVVNCYLGANLTETNLSNANLRNAYLTGAILNRTNFSGAIMPDGMKLP